jgi:DNA primase large subunit
LHALDYPREKILELFSRLPDFDSKIAEYQIDFAKKKEYTPHSCQTLKSLNLCMAQKYKDEICIEGYFSKKLDSNRPLTHPLFYFQIKQYRKSVKPKENMIIKRNENE